MYMLRISRNLIPSKCFHTKTANTAKELLLKVDDKIKGTFVENWLKFWKNVARDYKEVALDTRQSMKEKPLKTFVIFSNFALFTLLLKTNPNEQSFQSKVISCANDISLIHPEMRRKESSEHIRHLEKCYNKDLIRHTSFGIFSIIWEDNVSENCGTYESNCSYLKLKYSEWTSNILDVGILNIWWVISRKMLDYDVNY